MNAEKITIDELKKIDAYWRAANLSSGPLGYDTRIEFYLCPP